ncbi:unnamed protein product, partial [Oikopleura dioica]
RKQKRVISEEQ